MGGYCVGRLILLLTSTKKQKLIDLKYGNVRIGTMVQMVNLIIIRKRI